MLTNLFAAVLDRNRAYRIRRERRLHYRALAYWQSMKRNHRYPVLNGFAFVDREELADHAFLLRLNADVAPTFASAGSILCDEAELSCVPINLDDAPLNSLLRRFAEMWGEVIAADAPYVAEYEFQTDAGYGVSCRGVLLPLSSGGSELDWVLGVVSWKSEKLIASSPPVLEDAGAPGAPK